MREESTMNFQSRQPISGNDPSILFNFETVVIVGASEDPNRIGGAPIELLRKYDFKGQVYGLNPKYDTVQGYPCFPNPESLPDGIDVAIFCVSVDNIRVIMPELARKGLKAAVIFTAGFGESGGSGKAHQDWLAKFARENRIAVVGPNCVGQISFVGKRPLTFANAARALPVASTGRIALLSQSGGVATNIWADGMLSGINFSHMITTGNEADLGITQFLDYLAEDEATDVVLGYIEGLSDGLAFCRAAAHMQEVGKPLIVIKVGVSDAGQDVVASHTGQLSSPDAAYQAAFDRYGVIRVATLQDLNDYARVFSLKGLKPKVTAATTSGGAGVYVADLCTELGLEMSRLSPETEEKLSSIIPTYGRLRNPVDLTAQVVNEMAILENSLQILLDDPETGVLLFMLSGKGTPEQAAQIISLMKRLQAGTEKTVVLCWLGVREQVRLDAMQQGLIVYQDPGRFLRPLRAYFDAVVSKTRKVTSPLAPPPDDPELEAKVRSVLRDGRVLSERTSLDLIEGRGVDCPKRHIATSREAVAKVSVQIPYPCVMKMVEPLVAHKSDVGGVAIDIASPEALLNAWDRMARELGATEVMIAEQISRGVEVLVGCVRDSTFGMRLTLGSGGIWTNFTADTVDLVAPFTDETIREALRRLSIWPALSGARGQVTLAVDRLVETISAIAEFGWQARNVLKEFECNPVIVTAERAVVVDAIGFG
jgi:acetyltransferase